MCRFGTAFAIPAAHRALTSKTSARLELAHGSPTIGSKRWVFRQYDHMVRTNTIVAPGMGAGTVRVKGTDRALAMSVDGNGRYAGLVMVAEAHAAERAENAFVFDILRHADDMLLPSMTVQEAVAAFDRTESEVLVVVDAPSSRRVLGTLSEAHTLRRYLADKPVTQATEYLLKNMERTSTNAQLIQAVEASR